MASRGREFRGQAEELVEKVRELVTKQRERLAEVLEAGKEAARSTLIPAEIPVRVWWGFAGGSLQKNSASKE
jgi:hypothetical protein